ncbi:hypothetical protein ACKWTF_006373 [Chironomus riparius]
MKNVRKLRFFQMLKIDLNFNLDKDLPNAKEILSNAKTLAIKIMFPIKLGCTVTPTFYILMPITTDFVYYFFYGIEPTRDIPLTAKFFYDVTQSPAYELTYLHQIYGIILVCAYIIAMGLIYGHLCFTMSGHFEILRGSMNNMKIDEFVLHHLKLMDMTNSLNSIYKPMIFTLYFCGTALFVVLGLSVITADSLLKNLIPLMHGVAALIYFAIISYGSQKIMDSSTSIVTEAYNIDKHQLMIIMIAQKKLRLTTPFFEASFVTFSFMLSRSWSFIAAAKSFV